MGPSGKVEGATALKLKEVIRSKEQVMSWEYSRYHARRDKCGKEGVCVSGSDEWGRASSLIPMTLAGSAPVHATWCLFALGAAQASRSANLC